MKKTVLVNHLTLIIVIVLYIFESQAISISSKSYLPYMIEQQIRTISEFLEHNEQTHAPKICTTDF